MGRKRLLTTALVAAVLAAAPAAQAAGLVALGDSFSSGEGVPPYEGGACHRSPHAWPLVLAAQLGSSAESWACSGAVTGDVAAQIARLAADAHLVTISIGGNDLGFGEVLRNCVLRNCRRLYTRDGADVIEERIRRLARTLPGLYRRIQHAAPRARLLVMGYPRLFPRRPGRFTCAALGTITRSEIRYLNAKTAAADRAIRRAALRAGGLYVHALDAFEGGEIACGRGPRYAGARTFHPTAAGHARLAEIALAALAERVSDR
jgi:lysophospholipase L1-like esterase